MQEVDDSIFHSDTRLVGEMQQPQVDADQSLQALCHVDNWISVNFSTFCFSVNIAVLYRPRE